jgi:hypothetical protein
VPIVIAVVIAVVVLGAIVFFASRRSKGDAPVAPKGTVSGESGRLRPVVAEFHVMSGAARVHFEVPLPPTGADQVLSELLGREAVEVVREKRHALPLGDLERVVALGRRGSEWVEVATIGLETPGELPPPMLPELIPHTLHREFDPFAGLMDLPAAAPQAPARMSGERLEGLTLRLPAQAQAALRALGIDPAHADGPSTVLALMRAAGYQVSETTPGSYRADRAGQATFVRVVGHRPGDYPELDEAEVRRFVIDFGSSGCSRGVLLSEKWAPFEIHERERRDSRVRFVTRERLQAFADALTLG